MSRQTFRDIVNTSSQTYLYAKTSVNPEGVTILMSYWAANGNPIAGTYRGTGAGLDGEVLNAGSTGAMMYPTGATCYATRIQRNGIPTTAGCMILYDRLWQNTGFSTSVAEQSCSSVEWPQRDDSGLASGYGVYIALETSVVMNNLVSFTGTYITYTSSDNIVDRRGYIREFPVTANAGCFFPFSLEEGDAGVKRVQSLTLGSIVITGSSCHLVAYRPIAVISNNIIGESNDIFNLPMNKIYDNSCLAVVYGGVTTSANFNLCINFNR